MLIDFDDHPHYSGKESKFFEKDINEAIRCVHGYVSSADHNKNCKWVDEKTWEILNKCFPDATEVSKCPKTVSCNECSYVTRHKHDDIFDPPTDNEQTFSSSYFLKEPIETVGSIVIRLEEINTERW